MWKKIANELFGAEELSDDYLALLKNYRMTRKDRTSIRDETIEFVSSLNRPGTCKDYEMMLITIDKFRNRFSKRFEKVHGSEMNFDTLNKYKPNKLYWQITNDREKTMQILEPYTGKDFTADIFSKGSGEIQSAWTIHQHLRHTLQHSK